MSKISENVAGGSWGACCPPKAGGSWGKAPGCALGAACPTFDVVVAMDNNGGLGRSTEPGLPWSVEEDMRFFRETTTKGVDPVVIMGRATADTLAKPLPRRVNMVVTSQADYRRASGFQAFPSLTAALVAVVQRAGGSWGAACPPTVIGGAKLLEGCLPLTGLIRQVFITYIDADYGCDVRCPQFSEFLTTQCSHATHVERQTVTDRKSGKPVDITIDRYQPHRSTGSEQGYLDIMAGLLQVPPRATRNGLTRSRFGAHLEFDLSEGFPALTTKRLFWKGVVVELLFFLGGCTDNKWLQERGVRIWDGNTSQQFIDKMGLPYLEGDLGPMYGYQWRFFGHQYQGKDADYCACEPKRDQFAEVVDLILNDPSSRRILLTTYNYAHSKEGVLYPCHGLVTQFYVNSDYSIDCQMYQRSADWFLGVPFNIASYSLLVHIIVSYVNSRQSERVYRPGRVLMTFGDHHLYENHLEAAITQLGRMPKCYPRLELVEPVTSIEPGYFLGLSSDNFRLVDYQPHKLIRAEMVA